MLTAKCDRFFIQILLFLTVIFNVETSTAEPEQAIVGVATNFIDTIKTLQTDFEKSHKGQLIIVGGSTGKLYAQISQGAPIDVFLSADQARPSRLYDEGLALKSSQFTYAIGQLIVWLPNRPTKQKRSALNQEETIERLRSSSRIALANETLAPYGVASVQFLQSLGLYEELRPRIVRGENIGQTFSLISSGNANAGFIALAQALTYPEIVKTGHYWPVDGKLHLPIRQDAVLLGRAAKNPVARAFLHYLRSPAARKIMRAAGYATAD
jgi:molybdate transport system substrate-binding protein